ncbi:aldo/keto reductase [Pokkaliibacter sp. CJK22405]|uniref:aldo/keto reductase n=1 Tax=Pokkaliibacter sp. CJK22405 TaxID=3384615 RepID=UPI003984EF3E
MQLDHYRPFGHSGLIVSPLALGTMTFGTQRWGADTEASRAIFDSYVEQGGNFIDTANIYSGGQSETLVGEFTRTRNLRNQLVIATKSAFAWSDHPHAGGNGAKAIHTAVEQSLQRLQTDYIDLYWLHVWDRITPPEEVLQTMSQLVRAGKIRYWGISNAPAWYIATIVTLARTQGLIAPIALQFEYSLAERGIEAEHLPLAYTQRLAMQPWSPLAGGFLTGKYDRKDPANVAGQRGHSLPDGGQDSGTSKNRLSGSNPFGDSKFTERNWAILKEIKKVATELEVPCSQVALSWLVQRPTVAGTLIGVSKLGQLQDNLKALAVKLHPQHLQALDAISAPMPPYPANLFSDFVGKLAFGGHLIKPGYE